LTNKKEKAQKAFSRLLFLSVVRMAAFLSPKFVCSAAIGAAGGFVVKPFLLVKFLFTHGKHEIYTAIFAFQRFIL
jgi:hypothetical protein